MDTLLGRFTDLQYWLSVGSGLTISTDTEAPSPAGPGENYQVAVDRVRVEGYYDHPPVLPTAALDEARRAMDAVEGAGWLPLLAFVFDAPWRLARAGPVLRLAAALLGPEYRQLPAFRAYHSRPGSRGYPPYTEVEDLGTALNPDGTPRAVTIWVPLLDATADNGCMCVVPKDLAAQKQQLTPEEFKAEYGTTDQALVDFYVHRLRALPLPAGSLLAWHHFILQWASFASDHADSSLPSLAFEFVRADSATTHPHALLPSEAAGSGAVTFGPSDPLPTFEQRLFWIVRNLRLHLGYAHREAYEPMIRSYLGTR